jgi:hypothetical protein
LARHDNVTSRDRRGAGVVRVADLRTRAKPGNNDRKGAPAVRVAELKMHAKRGDKRRAS